MTQRNTSAARDGLSITSIPTRRKPAELSTLVMRTVPGMMVPAAIEIKLTKIILYRNR